MPEAVWGLPRLSGSHRKSAKTRENEPPSQRGTLTFARPSLAFLSSRRGVSILLVFSDARPIGVVWTLAQQNPSLSLICLCSFRRVDVPKSSKKELKGLEGVEMAEHGEEAGDESGSALAGDAVPGVGATKALAAILARGVGRVLAKRMMARQTTCLSAESKPCLDTVNTERSR